MLNNPPPELVQAVELINSYNRIPNVDPEIVLIAQCIHCNDFFVSLPADESYRKNNNKPALCRNCARVYQAQLLKERQKRYREQKKNKKV